MIIPVKINHNDNVTIVFWNDDTKTVVKCAEGTTPDNYAAFCAALAKKMYGTNTMLKTLIANAENYEPLKVGDKVKLLTVEDCHPIREMRDFVGKTVTVSEVDPVNGIYLEEDKMGFAFEPYWFKKIDKCTTPKLKKGDKIKLLDGSKIKNFSGGWFEFMQKDIGKIYTVDFIQKGKKSTGVMPKESTKWVKWDIRAIEKV